MHRLLGRGSALSIEKYLENSLKLNKHLIAENVRRIEAALEEDSKLKERLIDTEKFMCLNQERMARIHSVGI